MKLKSFKADLKPAISKHEFSSHKNIINKLLFGNMVSQMKNRGFEFEDYRIYTKNDDAERIDWKATLRAHQLLIRQTAEEKAVNVLFLVDVSDSMLFASGEKLKCEYAAEVVCALSYVIQREGNAIGLTLFNDKIVKAITPKLGTKQYIDMMTELARHKNYGGGCDLKNAIKKSMAMLKIPSLLIIISDYIDAGENWEKYLEIVSLKYNVIGICIRDRLDRGLPEDVGYFVLEDPSSEKKILIDTKEAYNNYKQKISDEEASIDRMFKRAKSSCLILQTDDEYSTPLIKFLEKRSRIKK
jgi:hypothetical protein